MKVLIVEQGDINEAVGEQARKGEPCGVEFESEVPV